MHTIVVGVAQSDRALGCGPRGRGFKSHHSPHQDDNGLASAHPFLAILPYFLYQFAYRCQIFLFCLPVTIPVNMTAASSWPPPAVCLPETHQETTASPCP